MLDYTKKLWLNRIIQIFLILFSLTSFATETSSSAFTRLADEYFDIYYFPHNPSAATLLGIHTYDNKIENYSKAGIDSDIALLQNFAKRVSAINEPSLNEQLQGDRQLILNDIHSRLLTLQTIRPWKKDPDYYSSGVTNSAFVIMEREFAPADVRLRALIAREKLMPAVLQEARRNLNNPPKIYTEIALEQLPGLISFFQKDVPAAFTQVQDEQIKKQFAESNKAVIKALQDYQVWLKTDLLPRSKGDFRIGKETFQKKLQYDEMVNIPLDKLLAIGRADLRKNQLEYNRVIKEINPTKTSSQVIAEFFADHPPADKLLVSFAASFDHLIQFIQDKKIITIPSDVRPIMQETPPFLRAITFASMDTPGPFEKVAKEAYFNVTLPNPTWNPAKIEDFMSTFTYSAIIAIAVHEAYPGHYIQFLWMHKVQDRVRKILGAMSNAEGWAHYCEQMILDEGYGQTGDGSQNDRDVKLLRLGQLQYALLRDARFIVGIEMHTGQMSFDQAVDFFVKQGYQSRTTATVETKRGTNNPTYLYYTLGKLQIQKLRVDLAAKQGKNFNLQQFHDDFMRQGYPPIKIVRKALLHDDSPTL